MTDSFAHREVAENVAYRFEDRRYSRADEDGEHAYTIYACTLQLYPIISYTKCGIWIGLNYAQWPRQPSLYSRYTLDLQADGPRKRFINLQANKKFATLTIEEAVISYQARKSRQISIYQARIEGAHKHLEAMRHMLRYQRVPDGHQIAERSLGRLPTAKRV